MNIPWRPAQVAIRRLLHFLTHFDFLLITKGSSIDMAERGVSHASRSDVRDGDQRSATLHTYNYFTLLYYILVSSSGRRFPIDQWLHC
jgi:hypothetical protein